MYESSGKTIQEEIKNDFQIHRGKKELKEGRGKGKESSKQGRGLGMFQKQNREKSGREK